ncbi:MAG: hypothetical protein ABEJ23_00340 [Haloarculaceae archaeon]
MAFDHVTFFELHFDGAQFGPRALPGTEDDADANADADDREAAPARRGRRVALVAFSVAVSVAAAVAARRMARRGERIEIEAVGDGVEAATEQ